MRAVRLLTAAAAAVGVVGCAPERGTDPAAAPNPASTPAAAASTAAPADIATPPLAAQPGGATDPAPPDPAGTPSRRPVMTPSPFDGDRGGDLVRGVRTLRGVVERDDDWVLLRVAGERWALLGDRPGRLNSGALVEVRGTLATPPPGCPVERALAVTRWG